MGGRRDDETALGHERGRLNRFRVHEGWSSFTCRFRRVSRVAGRNGGVELFGVPFFAGKGG